jgi:hypothetical protein
MPGCEVEISNKIQSLVFGPKEDEVSGHRLLYNKGFCDLYRSRSLVKTVKSRRLQ